MTEITDALLDYFKDRLELCKGIVPFSAFNNLRQSSFESLAQRRIYDEFDEPKAYLICLENMVGFKDVREKEISNLKTCAKDIACALYRCTTDAVRIKNTYLMTNASSQPIKIECSIGENGVHLDKTLYIKQFDPLRILGIEIYNILSGIEQYHFVFNDGIIVEDALEGKHEFDINEDLQQNQAYARNRVQADLLSFFMGLDDLAKKDNYLVSSDKKIKFIDFDVWRGKYQAEEIEHIKNITCRELGIFREVYNVMFAEEKQKVQYRVKENKDAIIKIITAVQLNKDTESMEIGDNILSNMEDMLVKCQ